MPSKFPKLPSTSSRTAASSRGRTKPTIDARPAPPPPAPSSNRRKSSPAAAVRRSSSPARRKERVPPSSRARDLRGAWETPYNVEMDEQEEIYEVRPPSRRRDNEDEDSVDADDYEEERHRQRREIRRRNNLSRSSDRAPEHLRSAPAPPQAPQISQEVSLTDEKRCYFLVCANIKDQELKRRRAEDEKNEKMQLLHRLYQYEQRGHNIANSYSMDSNIDELRFEISKIRNEESARHSVKWYKVFLMAVVSAVEMLNTKFDPFGLRLKGWSRDMSVKKDDLDDCFHRIHDQYSSKTAIDPIMELAFAFFGGAFMYHLDNVAENNGELGTLIGLITGGGGQQQQQQARGRAKQPTQPQQQQQQQQNYQNQQQQAPIMTNIPSFQQQNQFRATQYPQTDEHYANVNVQQSAPNNGGAQIGASGRRIMRPPMQAAGTEEMTNLMMMAQGPGPEVDMDVPIPADFKMPGNFSLFCFQYVWVFGLQSVTKHLFFVRNHWRRSQQHAQCSST